MIGVTARGSAIGKLNICAQHIVFFLMLGAVHFIYCITSSIATKVYSTYLGYYLTANNIHVFATSDIEITSPTLT